MRSSPFPGARMFNIMLALFMVLCALPVVVSAQEEGPQVTWDTYDVTIKINEDGTLRITESIVIDFHDSFRQGERSIPMNQIESIDDVAVSVGPSLDALEPSSHPTVFSGDPGTYSITSGDDEFIIKYGFERTSSDGSDSIRAVEISYTVHGVIRDYPDAQPPEQQVRWTAISSEITQTGAVESASAAIVLPTDIPEDRVETDPRPTSIEGGRIVWERENLGEGDSLQVAVAFPQVTDATAPSWQANADTYEGRQEHLPAINLVLGLVALVTWSITIIFMLVRGVKDPEVGLVADIIPERPDDLAPPLVGTLIDETVDTKDVLAGLLDLDRQGIVTIREERTLKAGKSDYQIVLNRPIPDAAMWERPMLEGLFGNDAAVGEEVDLAKQLKKLREKSFSDISTAYDDELFARGYFIERPHTTRMRWLGVIGVIFLVSAIIVLGIALWARMLSPWVVVPGVVTLFGVVTGGILITKAAVKTTEGAVEAAKWKAYNRYLDDLRKGPDPGRFIDVVEQDLAWAVALGFDSTWTKLAEEMPPRASTPDDEWERRRQWSTTPVFVGGMAPAGAGSSTSTSSSSGGGGLQGASGRALGAIGGGSAGMFAMLNDAAASFNAGSGSGSSSSGGFSGASSIGSSGGGGHSFS